MRSLMMVVHSLILLVLTPFLAYPEHHPVSFHVSSEVARWIRPESYDAIMEFLERLEDGELETTYSSADLEEINAYLVLLAQEGILPGQEAQALALAWDSYDLLYAHDSACGLAHADHTDHYLLLPSGKISHGWKKTKNFVKKHKKAIIIGAVVVVVVAAVTIAVVVASTSAASAAAGAASAAAGSSAALGESSSKAGQTPSSPSDVTPIRESSFETPTHQGISSYQQILDREVYHLKEHIVQESFFESTPSKGASYPTTSWQETGRIVGSTFAHDQLHRHNHLSSCGSRTYSTAQEMGQLRKAQRLESTINSRLDRLISQSESDVYKAAVSHNKHVKMRLC